MRGLFVTSNSDGVPVASIMHAIGSNFDKVAVQDEMPQAQALIQALNAAGIDTSVWTASPDDTTRLLSYRAKQIIIQGEDEQADAAVLNVAALRSVGYRGLVSVVSNLWPSRNLPWFDLFLHHNNVRLLVECYLPGNSALTIPAMMSELHQRGYPSGEPVLGLYHGFTLAEYAPLPLNYWIWDLAQAQPSDLVR